MQARRSILILASSALFLFVVGKMLLPGTGEDGEKLYQPREEASSDQEASGYNGALEYYKDIRGGGTPEVVRRTRKAVERFENPQRGSLDLDWNQQGPVNQGGRTRSIMILEGNRNEMWVGSVSGGIWRSFDKGQSWEPVPAFNEHVVVSDMVQTGDGNIYVATGNRSENWQGNGSSGFMGRGLFKTTDKGESFELVSGTQPDTNFTGDPWAFINEIEADPNNDQGLWIAHTDGLTYYDASNGNLTTTSGVIGSIQGLDVSSDGSHILCSSRGGSVFLSTDGGDNFTSLSSGGTGQLPIQGGRVEVAIAPSDKDYMYVSQAKSNQSLGSVHMTKNGGDEWGKIAGSGSGSFKPFYNGLSYQGNYDQAISVNPGDPGNIVLGGITLWEFDNEPSSFNPYAGQWSKLATTNGFPNTVPYYVHADVHTFEWRNSQELYVGCDGGVFYSDDGLESFLPSNKNFVSTQYYSIEFSPHDQILGGTQDNGTQYLDRSGRWSYATQVRGGDGFDCEISQIDPKVVFATIYGNLGSSPYVTRSETGGGGMSPFINATSVRALVDDFYSNIALFEDMNDTTSKDSIAYINTRSDSSTIVQGDSIQYESKTLKQEVRTTLKVDSLEYGDSVMVQDPVQSLFAFTGRKNGIEKIYLTRDALRLTKSSQSAHPVHELSGETVNTYAFSGDGNHLWVGMRNSGNVYRISNLDSAYSGSAFQNKVTSTQVLSSPGQVCTGISVDPNDPDHVVVSFGRYGGGNKVRQSFDATSSNPSWNSIWSTSNTNLSSALTNMPVYDVLIEREDPNVILAGTEYGIFASDDGGSTWFHQDKDPLGHVPVFDIEQQTWGWDQGARNPGHIYVGSHGRGMFKTDEFRDMKPKQKADAGFDESEEVSMELHPNPATERTFLSLSEEADDGVRVAIYDLNGKLVKSIDPKRIEAGREQRIQVSDLDQGVYIVRAKGDGFEKTSKLVVGR